MSRFFRRIPLLAGTALTFSVPAPVTAQQPEPTASEQPASEFSPDDALFDEEEGQEVVVVGARPRGSVIGDIPPENTLDSRDIRATGAVDVAELLDAIEPQVGSARGRGGGRPVLLLNGQRISGFRELRDIPTEAIQRVEILPEEVALKYGYRADQRVVNFVLRPRFRSTTLRIEGETASEGGYLGGEADATRLMIGEGSRTTINLHAEASSPLTEDERDILLDPNRPEPALDLRAARTLVGSRSQLRATATHNRVLFGDVSATGNLEVEHVAGKSLLGFAQAGDGLPPIGIDPRARDTSTDSAHAGFVLNGDKAGWRWSVTGNGDLARSLTRTDADDIDAGMEFGRDRARTTTASADVDATANGKLFALPAGDASATVRVGARTLHLDSSRLREGERRDNALGRTAGSASINVDLPVSRRNRDFSALGNLTLNANVEAEQLSDFGTLTTLGGGLNWSPVERLNLIASFTREEGAPTVQQLGDPILETAASRIFDFTRGETVLAAAITGGNPGLLADRRNVLKLGGNWKPFAETDLRLRAEYVRSRLKDPISSFPGPSPALEAAFPDRFVRDEDGVLVGVDLRPVNFDEARRDTLRWGFDFTKPLQSRRPSAAQIAQLRARRAQSGATPEGSTAPEAGRPAESRGAGLGRFGGRRDRRGGRLTLSLTHIVNLKDEVTIRPGLPELDYLHGDALGSSGGRPRHEVQARAGWSNNGLGAFLSGNWRSGSEVESAAAGALHFSPLATFDLRLFANLGQRFDLVSKHPWLRGTQLRLEIDNIFDARTRVRDAAGEVPFSYQPDLLDPLGRTIGISIRKQFLPPRSFFRREGSQQR